MIDVVMLAYNQSEYISQAIESALSQKGVELRLIIGEDCSTDNTLKICKQYKGKYPEKIVLLESERNLGLALNYKRCFDCCTSEYIAILEADDYWIDIFKLKKQLNIFNQDHDIGLVHCNTYILYQSKSKKIKARRYSFDNLSGFIFSDLFKENSIYALTVVFRRSLLHMIDYNYVIDNNFLSIDYYLWLNFARVSKIGFLDNYVSVYRVLDSSISNNIDKYKVLTFIYTSVKVITYLYENNYISEKLYQYKLRKLRFEILIKSLQLKDIRMIINNLKHFSIKFLFHKLYIKNVLLR